MLVRSPTSRSRPISLCQVLTMVWPWRPAPLRICTCEMAGNEQDAQAGAHTRGGGAEVHKNSLLHPRHITKGTRTASVSMSAATLSMRSTIFLTFKSPVAIFSTFLFSYVISTYGSCFRLYHWKGKNVGQHLASNSAPCRTTQAHALCLKPRTQAHFATTPRSMYASAVRRRIWPQHFAPQDALEAGRDVAAGVARARFGARGLKQKLPSRCRATLPW